MSSAWRRDSWDAERLAIAALIIAMVIAAIFFVLEGRGLTLLVDDWYFGFASRTDLDAAAFLDPHNGHLVAVPVGLTKASLQLFGADAALPLRLLAVAVHLSAAGCLFLLLRRAIGASAALLPTVLVLFLGAANDVLIGSHGLPFTIATATGLAAWLALERRRLAWDIAAAALLSVGIASDGVALPFVLGAGVAIWVAAGPRTRLWVAALPLGLYGIWWIGYGSQADSGFAIANVAAWPAFAFDALAASLGSIAGLFTLPGNDAVGFDLAPGQALAGGLLAVLLSLFVARDYRPGAAAAAPAVALLSLWLLASGVARAPYASRFLYIDVILLLLLLAREIAASPAPRRAALALAAICAVGLAPNVRELTYAADGARARSVVNRAVMGAADLVGEGGVRGALLEDSREPVGGLFADLGFPLEQYEASRERFGAPALTTAQIEASTPLARDAADLFLARALPVELASASGPPGRLPSHAVVSQTGGVLQRIRGCLRFQPRLGDSQVTLWLPPGGLWIRPAAGGPVPIGVARFGDAAVGVGSALAARASMLTLPPGPASRSWRAQLNPAQPLLLCGA